MGNELYQLVAVTKDGKEYVIELENENKNNKGSLEFIDSGTTRFIDEKHLAAYLHKAGKIPTTEVNFFIKYSRNGSKYLPIILDDMALCNFVKNTDRDNKHYEFILDFYKKIEAELFNFEFYYYIYRQNSIRNNNNGNFLNQKIMEYLAEFYELYIRPHDIYSNRADLQFKIINELLKYKQFRTIYIYYNDYIKTKENEKTKRI